MATSKDLVKLSILCVSTVFLVPSSTYGWGEEGHHTICKVAESLLSTAASNAVRDLLPNYQEGDLASFCSWADQMRFRYGWSAPLHFIDTPDDKCSYVCSRDCHNTQGEEGMCLEGAIKNYTCQLQNYGSSHSETNNLTEALLFLSHFMGDIHQPLHVAFTADKGGNTIAVEWYQIKSNLHHVWDTLIIETAMKDYYGNDLESMINSIQKNITGAWSSDVSAWEACNNLACPNPYAKESLAVACKWAYNGVHQDSVLEDDYFLSRLPVVEKQLAKGGVRLAATLNRIFGGQEKYKEATCMSQFPC